MNREELYKHVETELEWLNYYVAAGSKKDFDFSKPLYDQLSAGYAKKNLPLDQRCAFLRLTSDKKINRNTKYEDLIISNELRDPSRNIYTALEFWLMKYPEDFKKLLITINLV